MGLVPVLAFVQTPRRPLNNKSMHSEDDKVWERLDAAVFQPLFGQPDSAGAGSQLVRQHSKSGACARDQRGGAGGVELEPLSSACDEPMAPALPADPDDA